MACQSLLTGRKILFGGKAHRAVRGCPQGGKASPTLWSIAINDLLIRLAKQKNVTVVGYADGIGLLLSANRLRDLQSLLDDAWKIMKSWCREAQLELNLAKTEFVNCSRAKKNRCIELRIEGESIAFKDKLKYLGAKLTWKNHIEHLEKKTDELINVTRRFLWMNSQMELHRKLAVYYRVFLPKLNYASQVWFPDIKEKVTYMRKLDRLQRRVILAVTGAYRATNRDKLDELIGVCKLSEELEIKQQCHDLAPGDKKMAKEAIRNVHLNEKDSYHFGLSVMESRSRFTIWCISNCGPFRSFLYQD